MELEALVEDVDGDLGDLSIRWSVDGELAARDSTAVELDLAPGTRTISVIAEDSHGGIGFDTLDVEVAPDTTPPQIVGEPVDICLWPPNHESVVLESNEVAPVAVDDCDPNPTIVFISGSSSQPDNGIGDGNTTADVVVKPDSVCLRRERQGVDLAGRTYALRLVAVDAAGNTSPETTAEVIVQHDQRPPTRCDVSGGTAVSDGDPRCVPDPAMSSTRRGCQAAGSSRGGLIVLLIAMGLIARRRRYT